MSTAGGNAREHFFENSPAVVASRHLIDFIRWRFSTMPAGAYHWDEASADSPEQGRSEIYISGGTPIEPGPVGARPAVTVTENAMAFQGSGLNDHYHVDLATGTKVKMDILPTHLFINVLSKVEQEASAIAWFIANNIFTYREPIIHSAPNKVILSGGQRLSVSMPMPAGSLVADSAADDWRCVVITMPLYLQHSTVLMPLNKPIVRSISALLQVLRTQQPGPVRTTAPLQGTAIAQPTQTVEATSLPQTTPPEAQSSEPLQVRIETTP